MGTAWCVECFEKTAESISDGVFTTTIVILFLLALALVQSASKR